MIGFLDFHRLAGCVDAPQDAVEGAQVDLVFRGIVIDIGDPGLVDRDRRSLCSRERGEKICRSGNLPCIAGREVEEPVALVEAIASAIKQPAFHETRRDVGIVDQVAQAVAEKFVGFGIALVDARRDGRCAHVGVAGLCGRHGRAGPGECDQAEGSRQVRKRNTHGCSLFVYFRKSRVVMALCDLLVKNIIRYMISSVWPVAEFRAR